MKLETLGRHILIEFYNCDEEILKNPTLIKEHMNKAAKIANATIVESVFHHFNPYGVSGAVIISESHLAIHTWPEYGYAAVDVFTCGDKIDPWTAFKFLEDVFKSDRSESIEVPRGMVDKIRNYSKKELGKITFKPEEE
ncbi:adenosylmethionine decarboxylase [uncultured Cetobacterium sp.]|uniref:adenosylmethionine decarboxylase n=1 Tax=uncultured Cetobacterium sp. TaxID=527638 RepID=UPI002614F009|nr:adenosylmethionine decarboxylase [uncultured Cetobacterium sp.]